MGKKNRQKPPAGTTPDETELDETELDETEMDETEPDETPAAETKPSTLVRVRVHSAISFGGLVVRPKIDQTGRGKKGWRPKITPVEAIVPRDVAEAHGSAVVEILGDAPANAPQGEIVAGKPA